MDVLCALNLMNETYFVDGGTNDHKQVCMQPLWPYIIPFLLSCAFEACRDTNQLKSLNCTKLDEN